MKEDLDVKFKLFGIFLVVIEVIGIIYALFSVQKIQYLITCQHL